MENTICNRQSGPALVVISYGTVGCGSATLENSALPAESDN